MMRECYQRGYLRCAKRNSDTGRWEFLWREADATGKRIRRTAYIGTTEQYPTKRIGPGSREWIAHESE